MWKALLVSLIACQLTACREQKVYGEAESYQETQTMDQKIPSGGICLPEGQVKWRYFQLEHLTAQLWLEDDSEMFGLYVLGSELQPGSSVYLEIDLDGDGIMEASLEGKANKDGSYKYVGGLPTCVLNLSKAIVKQ